MGLNSQIENTFLLTELVCENVPNGCQAVVANLVRCFELILMARQQRMWSLHTRLCNSITHEGLLHKLPFSREHESKFTPYCKQFSYKELLAECCDGVASQSKCALM